MVVGHHYFRKHPHSWLEHGPGLSRWDFPDLKMGNFPASYSGIYVSLPGGYPETRSVAIFDPPEKCGGFFCLEIFGDVYWKTKPPTFSRGGNVMLVSGRAICPTG